MGSITPNTNTIRSGEKESVPDDDQLIGSKTYSMDGIKFVYGEGMLEGMEAIDAYRRHDLVAQWYEWCDLKYPGTMVLDWPDMASAAGEDVDIRLLIRGYPVAGYAILLFLEACYAVDKALCGTDLEALAEVKVWHMPKEMKAYKYLLSEEMKLWWATELGELENEIKSSFSNRVSLSWRITDLTKCLAKLEDVMECGEGIGTNIWTTMGEENGSGPPAGVDDAIYERVGKLKTSVEILCKALERSEQDLSSAVLPSASHRKVEPSG